MSEYWPDLENLKNIKRGDNRVYTAQIDGSNVIVKSTHHNDDLERDWKQEMNYVNFLQKTTSVAYYYAPGVVHGTDENNKEKKLVSVSAFADGICPECVYSYQLAWITNEDVVRSIGHQLANMRLASQDYTRKHGDRVK